MDTSILSYNFDYLYLSGTLTDDIDLFDTDDVYEFKFDITDDFKFECETDFEKIFLNSFVKN